LESKLNQIILNAEYLLQNNFFFNRYLGNEKPIKIEFDNESIILDYWIDESPLKFITHGWLASDDNSRGVFEIKTGRFYGTMMYQK